MSEGFIGLMPELIRLPSMSTSGLLPLSIVTLDIAGSEINNGISCKASKGLLRRRALSDRKNFCPLAVRVTI